MRNRNLRSRIMIGALGLVAIGAAMFGGGTAHAAAPVEAPADGRYCVVVIDKLKPGEADSKVLAKKCAATPAARAALAAPLEGTLLMTWYVDAYYGGGNTEIRSYGGPCDREGYGISDVNDGWGPWGWNDTISSFKTWNNCHDVTAYENINYGGSAWGYNGNVDYVGDWANDKISSFLIRSW